MNRFGEIVHELRRRTGLTLEQAARRIGSHKGYLSGIENGKVNPPSAKITSRIARMYDRALRNLGIPDAGTSDFVELAYVCKSPMMVRARLLELIHKNPLLRICTLKEAGRPELLAAAR